MMLRLSLRPWVPRRPLRVWPARVTRKPAPRGRTASSTHSALRDASPTWACTQPENGESLKTSLPATRSGSAGPRSGRSSSTPSNVSRPRSRSPSIAAAEAAPAGRPAPASSGRSRRGRSRSPCATAPPRARRRRSSATKGSSSTPMPLRPARPRHAARRIRAGTRPARLSSDARSRRSSAWRWLSGNWSRSTRRARAGSAPARAGSRRATARACSCSTANDSVDSQRGLDVGRAGVGGVDERQQPPLQDRAPARPVLADDLLLLERQRERLEGRPTGGAVRLLRGLEVGQEVALGGGRRARARRLAAARSARLVVTADSMRRRCSWSSQHAAAGCRRRAVTP